MFRTNLLRCLCTAVVVISTVLSAFSLDNRGITSSVYVPKSFPLIGQADGSPVPAPIMLSGKDLPGINIAAGNLAEDFARVCGIPAELIITDIPDANKIPFAIVAGSVESPLIKALFKSGKLNEAELKGKYEKYVLTTIDNPYPGMEKALVVAGSDRRGTIYGIYEISEQIGVSPWYDWADVTSQHHDSLYLRNGYYTAGEPAVKYRGIFLNDEGPCLMQWVKNTYGTDYGDHRFYGRVFELLLRLRANFLWPAMWAWAFYGDDAENSRIADEMGIIIGTSHHEPMARNHQEWARHRKDLGAWNYSTNQAVIDNFFAEGIRRIKGTEDVVTIGMRGDGDEAMSAEADVKLLKKIINNQRKIISKETGQPAKETPQVWALYKEVLDYYDAGLRVPDDVTLLLCDDNWGNLRRLPDNVERRHPGGWGMYYHVDYVGAPRNSKLLNCTPIQNLWEQMDLAYEYGVDRLWILNVGDLKPMEYPITLFLDMAWNPKNFTSQNLLSHTLHFFEQQIGMEQAPEAARIFNLLCKYNGRVTPEMLDRNTYTLSTGEWKEVADDYARLEAEALRQFVSLEPSQKDAYRELILFPLQIMSNLYEMYYAQAMNLAAAEKGLPEANAWADLVEKCFNRDKQLMDEYNTDIAGGKWNGMMIQKHIGYTGWNDDFPEDTMPEVIRTGSDKNQGGYTFLPSRDAIIIEAEHFNSAENAPSGAEWEVIPYMGRTLSGVALRPYSLDPAGAELKYDISLPCSLDSVKVHVVTKSTLAFERKEGHRYAVGFEGEEPAVINFNKDLNEDPENIYTNYYPVIARRVVEKSVPLKNPVFNSAHVKTGSSDIENESDNTNGYSKATLVLKPLDPGIVFEKIIIDLGGYVPAYLFGKETEHIRVK